MQPNQSQMNDHTKAAFLRGSIITSYAQVEFLLADITARWRGVSADWQKEKFPYSLGSRVRAVRDLANRDERFAQYSDEIDRLSGGLTPYREIRDMMAHGMQLLRENDQVGPYLDYRMYRVGSGGVPEVGQMTTSLDQLEDAALEIGRFAVQIGELCRRIYQDLGLEPVA